MIANLLISISAIEASSCSMSFVWVRITSGLTWSELESLLFACHTHQANCVFGVLLQFDIGDHVGGVLLAVEAGGCKVTISVELRVVESSVVSSK